MKQALHDPPTAVTAAVSTVQKAGRFLLPFAIVAAITGGGLLVFFALVTAVIM